MLFTAIILLNLFEIGYFGDEEIVACADAQKRPTVDPSYCIDASPETCAALFKKEDATYGTNLDP